MKFTHTQISQDGKETREYTIDKNNKVTEKITFEHDKFIEFDKWFEQLEKEYNEQQENKSKMEEYIFQSCSPSNSNIEHSNINLNTNTNNPNNDFDIDLGGVVLDVSGENYNGSSQFKKIGTIDASERKKFASDLNIIKDELQDLINLKINEIEKANINEKLEKEKIDVTLPERSFVRGKIHPVSQTIDEISSIFSEIGFSVEEGPDVENEYNNFTALNTPDNHPARDMHDTFYLDEKKERLLRTHTSPVQIRTMLKDKPPFKIIAPGRTYRSDSDQTHSPMFHQVEGLHIDKNINMGHLKGCLNYFIKEFFEVKKIKMRFRPSHFPFTEPSAEVDIGYEIKDGKIIIGEGDQWLEILGCGMVHPNVLKNVKVDSAKFQGYAFGIGIDRLAMLKYGINDLRAFFDCDYRWLNHFGFDPLDVPTNYRGLSR